MKTYIGRLEFGMATSLAAIALALGSYSNNEKVNDESYKREQIIVEEHDRLLRRTMPLIKEGIYVPDVDASILPLEDYTGKEYSDMRETIEEYKVDSNN